MDVYTQTQDKIVKVLARDFQHKDRTSFAVLRINIDEDEIALHFKDMDAMALFVQQIVAAVGNVELIKMKDE